MTVGSSRIGAAVKRRLQTSVGKRFSRFIVVAAGAVVASQITLTVCLGPVGWTAGRSAVAAWLVGAAVSYILSRWAWERKGRPNLLKETLPFWIVAVGTAVVLTLTTKWANQQAISMGLSHVQRVLFADLAYFLANCVTFVTRFLIFHYILFKDRGSKVSELVLELPASEMPGARPSEMRGGRPQSAAGGFPSAAAAGEGNGSEPFAAAGSAARVNGSAWSDNTAERSPGRVPARDDAAFPEPGTRR
jgi:putative flippase GtrA